MGEAFHKLMKQSETGETLFHFLALDTKAMGLDQSEWSALITLYWPRELRTFPVTLLMSVVS